MNKCLLMTTALLPPCFGVCRVCVQVKGQLQHATWTDALQAVAAATANLGPNEFKAIAGGQALSTEPFQRCGIYSLPSMDLECYHILLRLDKFAVAGNVRMRAHVAAHGLALPVSCSASLSDVSVPVSLAVLWHYACNAAVNGCPYAQASLLMLRACWR
jgi:hypothetical protein